MGKRGRPGAARTLSEDDILDATLSLLDVGGVEAARVGVAPNAIYTYFPDKSAVLSALVERLLGEVDQDALIDSGRPWRERVEHVALNLRAQLMAHPGAVSLMIGGPMDGLNALTIGERLLELLADAGLDRTAAARASYLLIVYVFGSLALEVAELEQPGSPPPEAKRIAARRLVYGAIPAEHFPHTAAVAGTLADYISTEQYLWGLRRVLDGIGDVGGAPG
jgi:TetR/AcrR family transcriptional regulator, tetracycline repressor protein